MFRRLLCSLGIHAWDAGEAVATYERPGYYEMVVYSCTRPGCGHAVYHLELRS